MENLLVEGSFPNFDCMATNDIGEWLSKAYIVLDGPEACADVVRAVDYATHILDARAWRLAGDIRRAHMWEAWADAIYADISPSLRW